MPRQITKYSVLDPFGESDKILLLSYRKEKPNAFFFENEEQSQVYFVFNAA